MNPLHRFAMASAASASMTMHCLSATPASKDGALVPPPFQGLWNDKPENCNEYNEARLRITAKEINFYESIGPIRSVKILSPSAVVITARLRGEGNTWTSTFTMTLKNNGSELLIEDGGLFTRRVLCKSGLQQ